MMKKSLMILLSIIMVFTMAAPVAFADEDVTITFANSTIENYTTNAAGLRITNVPNATATSKDHEGTFVGNEIVFNFSTEMDVTTLNPENIKIYLGETILMSPAETRLDTTTMEWTYTKYNATSTTYTIYISDMCEGTMPHIVTFTSGVKTATGASINPVEKKFRTARIATVAPAEGKEIVNVAFGKKFYENKPDGKTEKPKWTNDQPQFTIQDHHTMNKNDSRIDLGNYYDIEDMVIYVSPDAYWTCNHQVDVRYSNDPEATWDTATSWASFPQGQYAAQSALQGADWSHAADGRGFSRRLKPTNAIRARYIFVKSINGGDYGEAINEIRIYASVDTDYKEIKATKGGADVTEFTGAGEYVVTVPVKEYVAGSSNGYMIVAGYDANGIITKINCAPVNKANDELTLATTFTDTTKTVKAVLIKDFTQPQMLTDALVLESAQN